MPGNLTYSVSSFTSGVKVKVWSTVNLFEARPDFDVSLTVHLSITLANDQFGAQIFNTCITVLYMYMFRAISCSSSGGQIVLILINI
jgi:hypothetical protein